jgi:serine phosphatase RsbU (regulator of sigma subunit)
VDLLEEEATRIMSVSRGARLADERVHVMEVVDGLQLGHRHVIDAAGATIGRRAPAEIVLQDSEISRAHCRLTMRGDELWVADLASTNGTFLNGRPVTEPVAVPIGALLQVGGHLLKHESRTRQEWLQSDELDRDLEQASSYVNALLPQPMREGPILADWHYQPCAKLGGDAFGYGFLPDGKFAWYLMDVCGHGAGAAMHSVSVMNLLRQRALPDADMSRPAEVLGVLNDMYQMDSHDGMYFTIWYGVYDGSTRELEYASAGHHPAYLIGHDRAHAEPLRTRSRMIGAMPGRCYSSQTVTVPPGSSIHLFSDGVFEVVTIDGVQCTLDDFLPLLLKPAVEGLSECRRLYDEVNRIARPGGLDDDFTMVVTTFA